MAIIEMRTEKQYKGMSGDSVNPKPFLFHPRNNFFLFKKKKKKKKPKLDRNGTQVKEEPLSPG